MEIRDKEKQRCMMHDARSFGSNSKVSETSGNVTTADDGRRAEGDGRLRIAIADDDPVILDQICSLLGTRYDVVARAADGRALVASVQELLPAVVVSDITMPEINGIEAARQITQTCPGVKVIMLSVHDDPVYVEAALEAGASGYVLKLGASSELIPAIEDAVAGKPH
ncbi:MAG TPA: response regulator transcription factor, partial [Kiloniellales bacterium]